MTTVKQMQVSEANAKTLRAAVKEGENVQLFDGGEPVAQLVISAAELKRRGDFLRLFPHDPADCFGTCWRHDGKAAAEAENEAAVPTAV